MYRRLFQNWIKQLGMVCEATTAYSPESNGRAERLERTLIDMARTMLHSAPTAPSNLWAEAVHTACFIKNRLVTQSCTEHCTPST